MGGKKKVSVYTGVVNGRAVFVYERSEAKARVVLLDMGMEAGTPLHTVSVVSEGSEDGPPLYTHGFVPRWISGVAHDIRESWTNVYFGAVPYLEALRVLTDARSVYGVDSAKNVATYFLANANGFRGRQAQQLKLELEFLVQDGSFL